MGRPKLVRSTPARPPAALAAAAFKKIKPRLAQLKPDEVSNADIDVPTAVSIALGALPNLRPMRDAITQELPKLPIVMLDELEDYALAAFYAHLLHENQGDGGESTKKVLEEATPLRESLLIAAEALAHRGLLDTKRVAEIRSGHGHQDIASDLLALSALFSSQWERVKSKTAVEQNEVARAEELGTKLVITLGAKDAGSSKPVDSAALRARAFTLLLQAYNACRRAVSYLRWEQGDVDDLAPSLFRKTPGRKPGSATPKAPEVEVVDTGEVIDAGDTADANDTANASDAAEAANA